MADTHAFSALSALAMTGAVNLVAAVALALPLAFEVKEPGAMNRPPREPGAPLLGGFVVMRTFVAAVLAPQVHLHCFWSLTCLHCDEAPPFVEGIPATRRWVEEARRVWARLRVGR